MVNEVSLQYLRLVKRLQKYQAVHMNYVDR